MRDVAGTLAALLLVATWTNALAETEPAPTLEDLLPRLGRVAGLYRDTALDFACLESIAWRELGGSVGSEKFAYVFTHDEDGKFDDFRADAGWLRRAGKPKDLFPEAPMHLSSAYFWIFLFKESRRPFHAYRIVGEEWILDRPAVRIEFEPVPPIRDDVNDWYGTAWIDLKTSQLLRVEAYTPDDWATKRMKDDHVTNKYGSRWVYEYQRIVTDFTVVKNGMRFPGEVRISESRYNVKESGKVKEIPLTKVTQTYRDYRFFSVRTADEISAIIEGAK